MLEKLFMKNYKDTDNEQVRLKYGIVSSCYGIITNLILFAGKLLLGLISGSIAIISDAVNNLSDCVS
jgi:divalent metal cation (Fe/Co/Zn/Cd) transporter